MIGFTLYNNNVGLHLNKLASKVLNIRLDLRVYFCISNSFIFLGKLRSFLKSQGIKLIHGFPIDFSVEGTFVETDDFVDLVVLLLELLMMAPTLQSVSA